MSDSWSEVPSPVGDLLLTTDGEAVTRLWFTPHKGDGSAAARLRAAGPREDDHPVLRRAVDQLGEYFAGSRTTFDLPLNSRGSAFQRRVWAALLDIPYGETESYGSVARRLGLPVGAARAIGLANGSNPISVVVPCHRVIGANGSLTGYGGGIENKRFLLDLERGALF